MTTATLEKQSRVKTYPEIPYLPKKSVGFCPFGLDTSDGFPPDMPEWVKEAINRAVPVFGMTIQVFYPLKDPNPDGYSCHAIWTPKGDPLVIGQKDGKLYLITAWD